MALTAERLRELLDYNPETGIFTWKILPRRKAIDGFAGSRSGRYIYIGIDREHYLAHRLAWFYIYGEWPDKDLDHIDRDTHNNRLTNLRPATMSDNLCNSKLRKDNSTGFRGIFRHRSKFAAQVRKDGVRLCLGTFDTAEEAHAAYCEAARKLHGEFASFK
jgi:hypothetical protein